MRSLNRITNGVPLLYKTFSPFIFSLAVISVYFIVLVPVVFIFLLGTTLLKRKNSFTAVTNTVLIGIWMIAIIAFGVIAVDIAPRAEMIMNEYKNSDVVERNFDLSNFDRVYISEAHTATIVPGDIYAIKATGRERDFERLELEVDRSQLQIINNYNEGICLFCFSRGIDFEITMPELTEIKASGASQIVANGFFPDTLRITQRGASKSDITTGANRVVIDVSGASWLNLVGSTTIFNAEISGASKLNTGKLILSELNLKLSGASRAELSGTAEIAIIEASGSSKVYAFPMIVDRAKIRASSASQVELEVAEEMDVDASGASKINYRGNPEVSENLSGASKLEGLKAEFPDGREFEININNSNY